MINLIVTSGDGILTFKCDFVYVHFFLCSVFDKYYHSMNFKIREVVLVEGAAQHL